MVMLPLEPNTVAGNQSTLDGGLQIFPAWASLITPLEAGAATTISYMVPT